MQCVKVTFANLHAAEGISGLPAPDLQLSQKIRSQGGFEHTPLFHALFL